MGPIGLPSRTAGTQCKSVSVVFATLANLPRNPRSRSALRFSMKPPLCLVRRKPPEVHLCTHSLIFSSLVLRFFLKYFVHAVFADICPSTGMPRLFLRILQTVVSRCMWYGAQARNGSVDSVFLHAICGRRFPSLVCFAPHRSRG